MVKTEKHLTVLEGTYNKVKEIAINEKRSMRAVLDRVVDKEYNKFKGKKDGK